MKLQRLFYVLVSASVVVMCGLVCAACGAPAQPTSPSSSETPVESSAEQAFEGEWELVRTSSDGTETSQEDIERLQGVGLNVHLVLQNDGTALLDLFKSVEEGTWKALSDTEATLEFPGDETITIHISDGRLFMPQGSDQLEFVKSETSSGSAGARAQVKEIEPIQLVDDETVSIQVIQQRSDQVGDVGYVMRIENKTDQLIRVSAVEDSFSINGQMVNLMGGQALQPGKYAEVFFWFDTSVSGPSSIEDLKQAEGTLQVTNEDGTQVIATYQVQF